MVFSILLNLPKIRTPQFIDGSWNTRLKHGPNRRHALGSSSTQRQWKPWGYCIWFMCEFTSKCPSTSESPAASPSCPIGSSREKQAVGHDMDHDHSASPMLTAASYGTHKCLPMNTIWEQTQSVRLSSRKPQGRLRTSQYAHLLHALGFPLDIKVGSCEGATWTHFMVD